MRNLAQAINRHVVQPLYYWKNRDSRLSRFSELERSQWLSTEGLKELQDERLRRLIQHSYSTTKYYRNLFDQADIAPSDIRSVEDLQVLPVLDKPLIQEHMESMISSAFAPGQLIPDSSGGSTGVPTNFMKDIDRHRIRRADQIRHDQWCGWRLGERYALLWGAKRDLSLVRSTKEKLMLRYVDRSMLIDAFDMRDSDAANILDQIQRFRPTMLIGYANALLLLAQQMNRQNLTEKLPVKGVISSAETLTDDSRREIEESFGCKVFNRYGSREVGLIASECDEQDGLHMNFENVVVEVLDGDRPAKPNQRGEIVVTDLSNFGMPFLRYRMGDVGSLSENLCNCGRGLPLLNSVEGRVSDFFIAADGTKIHGEYYTHLFYGIPGVRQFQLIQESPVEVRVRLVTLGDLSNDILAPILEEIQMSLGGGTVAIVEYCNDIKPTPSGKYLFTISKVAGNQD